ncbi:MAG TPA: DUF5666 domain-containing protein [Gemmatimonadaceae bacterium]
MIVSSRISVRFAVVVVSLVSVACGRGSESSGSDTESAVPHNAAGGDSTSVRGTVASVSDGEVVVAAPTGNVTVKLTQPFQVYDREPATLADVKDNVFVGVTTVKQPDGSERATEIHIFPEELRGMGAGSRMMTRNAGAGGAGNRMTNGAVSNSRMTNGTAAPSRMSNGNVSGSNGSSLDVQFPGGSQKVSVPPNTRVTELKATSKKLSVGDQAVILARKNADGTLSANRALLAGK